MMEDLLPSSLLSASSRAILHPHMYITHAHLQLYWSCSFTCQDTLLHTLPSCGQHLHQNSGGRVLAEAEVHVLPFQNQVK